MAKRGAAYPSMSLEDAIERARKVDTELGKGRNKRSLVLSAIGYKSESGASKRAVASLVYYGLLDRYSDEYQLSETAKKILYPIDEKEVLLAKQEAALSPELHSKIYHQFVGDALPASLRNILVLQYNVVSPDGAVKNFKDSLVYAELLDDEGRLLKQGILESDVDQPYEEEEEVQGSSVTPTFGADITPTSNQTPTMNDGEDLNRIEIVLREGVKAGIYAPHNLSDAEKTKLKTIIDLL